VHDEIVRDARGDVRRKSNGSGGLEGGMTTGEDLVVRVAMKPISTLRRALRSVDVTTGAAVSAAHERSDVCAAPAASVVAEAVTALVLVQALLGKTGGDALDEIRRNLTAYVTACRALIPSGSPGDVGAS
jgi:chorismate synthase